MKPYLISKKIQFLIFILIIGLCGIATVFLTSTLFQPTNTCEIIITKMDKTHILELEEDYPGCKIILKDQLHKYDMIEKISRFFK